MPDDTIVTILPAPLKPGVLRADKLAEPEPASLMANGVVSSDGITLVYAKGGTGKGLVCVEIARQLLEEGHNVLIIDFEHHYSEWYSRINGLIPDAYKSHLYLIDGEYQIGSIKDMEAYLRDVIRDYRVTVLIVDSYGWAKPKVGSRGSADPSSAEAIEFGNALMRLGLPTLVTSHVAKVVKRRPEPYGSVYLVNVCRAVWYMEKAPTVLASQHRIQLSWHKGNGFEPQKDIMLTFTFSDGTPVNCEWVGLVKTLVDKIYNVLLQKDSTHAEVFDELRRRYPRDISIKAESVRQTMLQYSKEGPRQKFIRLPKPNPLASQIYKAKRV